MDKLVDNKMINKIKKLLQEARTHVAVEVNNTLLRTYMEIGKLLVEDINLHENEENYQNKTISMLSKELTRKFGKGFSRANIWNMITFYKEYGSVQTVSERLSWSHYCELLSISDKAKRHFYEIECANSRWSVRELRRQIASSLFERLLLSDGKANKQKVLELSLKGNEIVKPQDIVKDPYVFEFLGIPENKPMMESDLEEALVRQIEKFLLELGKGFMFVGTQQRVTFGNKADVQYVTITPKTFPAPEDAKPLPQPERVWGNASLEWWIPEWKDMPTQYHIVQGLASLPILRVVGASKVHLWHYNDVYHQKAIE